MGNEWKFLYVTLKFRTSAGATGNISLNAAKPRTQPRKCAGIIIASRDKSCRPNTVSVMRIGNIGKESESMNGNIEETNWINAGNA